MVSIFANIALALALGTSGSTTADADWSVGAASFQPGKSTQAIRERLPLLKDMGGTAYIKVDNNGDDPVIITDIIIEERSIDVLLRSHNAFWFPKETRPTTAIATG